MRISLKIDEQRSSWEVYFKADTLNNAPCWRPDTWTNKYIILFIDEKKKTCLADGMENYLATVNGKQIVGLQSNNWFSQVCCL